MNQKAYKAWVHGHIITMNEKMPSAEAMAADQDGNLIYVGSEDGVQNYLSEETIVEDLKGHVVTPGFIEGHSHPDQYGNVLRSLKVRDVSKEEILRRVAEAVPKLTPGKWLVAGMGFNNEVWADPSYPTKEELDAVAPDVPVFIPRMDGHMAWANSRVFELCGITKDTPNPEGGEFFRTESGELQGCVVDKAMEMVQQHIPAKTMEERKEDYLAAQRAFLSFGITSVNDMWVELPSIQALTEICEENKMKVRYYGGLMNFTGKNANAEKRAFLAECPKTGLYHDHLTFRCCKFLGDGAVGAQSAHLKEAYTDRPGHTGIGMYTDEELYDAFKEAADHGMQIAIHAIGDATIEQVLNTYRRLQKEKDYGDHRWRLEHFQTVTSDTPAQAAELHVIPSMQPMHAPNSAGMAPRRLGPNRVHGAYAAGLVLKSTGMVSLGSDAPVATPSPFSGMHAAITRTNDALEPKGGFCMENALTPEEALKGYTIWGAYAIFAEDKRGSLEVGKYADFVVMDQDPLKLGHENPDALLDINVLETVVGGESVYKNA